MKNGLIIGTIACMVAIILVGSVLAPVINTTTTTTIKVDNDGAVGLRMEKITTGNFTITFDEVDGEFTATNGSDAQIIDDVCIFYADNNVAVWLDDSSVRMVGVDADNKTFNAVLSDSAAITITKSSEGVNITDGTVDKTFPVPSWSFVPKSTGAYGFFLNETEVNTAGMDTLFVGSFAGVDCYNGINTYDLPIVLDKTASGSTLSGAKWIKAAAEPEELNPDDLHIIPLDPEIITPIEIPDASLMAIPTPTYTDGDWGYDVVEGNAKIVSYSGTGGNVTIPSTVGGYTVVQVGKDSTTGTGSNYLMNNSQLTTDTTLTFPASVQIIGAGAFSNSLTNLKGVVLPDGVSIGRTAFFNTGLTTINIPDNAIVYGYAFQSCQATSLNIGNNVKFAEGSTFKSCMYLDGTVNIPSTTTFGTTGGIFEGCSNIDNFIFPDDLIPCYSLGTFFYNCSGWVKNNLIIYDGVETVGYETFYNCRSITGKLIIPNSVKNISSEAFYNCRGFDTLISFMDSDSVIGTNPFRNTNSLKTILNFGTLELTTTSYGLNADVVQDNIPALGYLAVAQYNETVHDEGPMAAMFAVIPLIMVIAILMFAVGFAIYRRME